ncbi:TetR/AcrR family transcriptional regulator [Streptomyces sp. CNZ287]|uniref:TetR family transcriptional regulator n=1 Tax=Streptomyces sp. B22F1 TaxID=3153566 RepID=UPI00119C4BFB
MVPLTDAPRQPRGRGPQQDRSRATRQRLLEAAVACLAELGWGGSTVSVVAERAGVSRGAAQHHFPTREDLFTAAVEHVAAERSAALRGLLPAAGAADSRRAEGADAIRAAPTGAVGAAGEKAVGGKAPAGTEATAGGAAAATPLADAATAAVVRGVVDLYTGPLFRAALQLWVAAANEEQLRPRVAALEARVGREAHRMTVALLGADESVPGVRETVQGFLDMARGLGLATLLTDDSARRDRVVTQWSHLLTTALSNAHPR